MKPQQFILALGAIAMTALPPTLPARAETTAQLGSLLNTEVGSRSIHSGDSAADERTSHESPACYDILQKDLTPDSVSTAQTDLNNSNFQQALTDAAKYYRIHVLSKIVNGQPKYLVVMTPGLRADDAEAADQSLTHLMGHFDQIGLTGHGSALGSILSEKALQRWRRKTKNRPRPKRFRLARRLAHRIIARLYGSYSQLDDPGVLNMYLQAKSQNAGDATDGSEKPIALDANYSPSGWEHLDSIGSTVTWGLALLFVGISSHVPHGLTFGAEWLITATSTYRFAMRYSLTSPNLKLNPWYQRIFPLGVGFIRGKSTAIANSIEASLAGHKSLLAVVPQNHIDEVVSLLENVGYEQRN